MGAGFVAASESALCVALHSKDGRDDLWPALWPVALCCMVAMALSARFSDVLLTEPVRVPGSAGGPSCKASVWQARSGVPPFELHPLVPEDKAYPALCNLPETSEERCTCMVQRSSGFFWGILHRFSGTEYHGRVV